MINQPCQGQKILIQEAISKTSWTRALNLEKLQTRKFRAKHRRVKRVPRHPQMSAHRWRRLIWPCEMKPTTTRPQWKVLIWVQLDATQVTALWRHPFQGMLEDLVGKVLWPSRDGLTTYSVFILEDQTK